jgi:hypothetical protein
MQERACHSTATKWFIAILAGFAVVLAAGCGGDDKPTVPADPNQPMYGTWNGTLNMVFSDGTPTQDSMTLTLGKGSVALWLSGAQYPATLQTMTSTSVVFSFNIFGANVNCSGARTGSQMTGGATATGLASGNWAVTKSAAARSLANPAITTLTLEQKLGW